MREFTMNDVNHQDTVVHNGFRMTANSVNVSECISVVETTLVTDKKNSLASGNVSNEQDNISNVNNDLNVSETTECTIKQEPLDYCEEEAHVDIPNGTGTSKWCSEGVHANSNFNEESLKNLSVTVGLIKRISRRATSCTESVLQNAIARKEKCLSLNETISYKRSRRSIQKSAANKQTKIKSNKSTVLSGSDTNHNGIKVEFEGTSCDSFESVTSGIQNVLFNDCTLQSLKMPANGAKRPEIKVKISNAFLNTDTKNYIRKCSSSQQSNTELICNNFDASKFEPQVVIAESDDGANGLLKSEKTDENICINGLVNPKPIKKRRKYYKGLTYSFSKNRSRKRRLRDNRSNMKCQNYKSVPDNKMNGGSLIPNTSGMRIVCFHYKSLYSTKLFLCVNSV